MAMLHNKRKGMIKGFLVLILALFTIPHTIFAQNNGFKQPIKTPFNIGEVIERFTQNRLREGEFLIDTCIVYVPSPLHQYSPAVAFDGTNYLVVWDDYRSGSNYSDIYGARVAPDGTILDPGGILISTAANSQNSPAVAFDGTNYLVVWQDYRSGYSSQIYGARVAPDGAVLDPSGIAISSVAYRERDPAVAFDGTNYLVVWEDYRSGSYFDIYGARVSTGGVVLDPQGIAISTATNSQNYPSVAFDGTNYLVVWYDYRSGSYSDIYGARVSTGGVVLDPQGIAISTATNSQNYPAVAFDGTNYLVVWNDYRSGYLDIYGARVSPNGTVLDPNGIPISTAPYGQYSPSVAFDGTNYLVVWSDERSGYYIFDIYGARVSPNGTVLDPAGIPISTAAYDQRYPSVAFDGTNYLVVWQDYRSLSTWDIYGARVSTSGAVLDPAGIPISTAAYGQYSPSVAFDGTNYLVVWQDNRSGSSFDIYGARVSTSGTVLDPAGIPISTAPDDQYYSAVAFDGTNYLVVWEDCRSGSDYSDIYGARVAPDGTVLDPAGIPISTAANLQYYPAVAFDGTNYLVVWADRRNIIYSDIYGTRVASDGAILDPQGIAISTAVGWQWFPSVAFDGTNYLVVWQDYRSGSDYDIYGARVSPSGVVIDSFAVSTQRNDQISPVLAHGQGNQLFIVYSGFVDNINNHHTNTMRIWGKSYQFIGIEEGERLKVEGLKFEVLPNPFSSSTRIRYSLAKSGGLLLKVYNIAGQCVKTLLNVKQDAGVYDIKWDGRDDNGLKLPRGIYLLRIETDGYTETKKMVLLH
ncbi:MAG: FlgD immunoglobulin-like domain containing protein [candidate division WOR-3 bacterium]